jgi:hypothetical protein
MLLRTIVFLILFLSLCLTFRMVFASVNGIEMPGYKVLLKDNDFETRHYENQILAQTIQAGDRQQSSRSGFKKLFAYISGFNKTHEKISMTAPVLQQQEGENWRVAFIMPKAYVLSELPKPLDNVVQLQTIKASDFYCLRFSGRLSDKNLQSHLNIFQVYLKDKNYKIDGEPMFAFYDPPWTLPFLRRNEIWGKVLKSDKVFENPHDALVEDKAHHKTHR